MDKGSLSRSEFLVLNFDVKSPVAFEKISFESRLSYVLFLDVYLLENSPEQESLEAELLKKDNVVPVYAEKTHTLVFRNLRTQTVDLPVSRRTGTGERFSLFHGNYVAQFWNSQKESIEIPITLKGDHPLNLAMDSPTR